jgi:Flp pilus assembly protein TadG
LRHQKGQAIVLIAIILAALVGMVALAVDGSRAYTLRRDIQAAVDAAALAAGDKLQSTGNYSTAEQAATDIFSMNLRLYAAPSCSPYGTPGASPFTVTCTYPDGTVLTQVASALGAQGSHFSITATRSLNLQFARILTNGASPTLAAAAAGGVNNLLYTPAIGALNQAGCGGVGGSAISISGSGTLNVNGDVVSSGAISVATGALRVAGDIYSRCQSPVPGAVTTACYPSGASSPCTYPDVAGATRSGFRFVDPNYPAPPITGGSQPRPGNTVILNPGTYAANPIIGANRCYFLSGGVYAWQGGFNSNGGFASNELKPPDEPNPSNNQVPANVQFWNTNGVNCAGSFRLAASGGLAILQGTWGVEVTSVRRDTYNGTSYARESAPSMCKTIAAGPGQFIQLQISNVPGATGYNIYLAPPPNGCAGPFGFVATLPVPIPALNTDTSGCPFGGGSGGGGNGQGTYGDLCTLGYETYYADAALLGLTFAPNPLAAPGTFGAYPPDSETAPLALGLPNQNPPRGNGATGDRANENNCESTVGSYVSCPGPITPGAVEFYVPAGGCMSTSNVSDTYVFSGYQYNWVSVYEPGALSPPANSCANSLGANANSAYVGLFYSPAASITVRSSHVMDVAGTGGLIADRFTFNGSMPTITYSSGYAPGPPATRLVG